jgi:uncharacterized protein (TIGR02246 family)
MTSDERAIREWIDEWMRATKAGDSAKALSMLADDVVFMVPGREPFGKEAFAAASEGMKNVTIDGRAEIIEVQVLGDWAFVRNRLEVTMTPAAGPATRRAGYTLSLFRRAPDGRWLLARDANLLSQ